MWVSRFSQVFDTTPRLLYVDDAFFETWRVVSAPDWANKKAVGRVKNTLPAFSVGIWGETFTRGAEGVLGASGVVLEFDDGSPLEPVAELFASYKFYLYTSFQHTLEHPRWRLVLPFAEPVQLDEHAAAWAEAAATCTARGYTPDPTSCQPSRLYYLPTYTPRRGGAHLALTWQGAYYTPPERRVVAPPAQPTTAAPTVTWGVERATVEQIDAACAFSRYATDHAATLPEPQWRAALSIWLRCKEGARLAHERSQPYPQYSYYETQGKIEALRDVGAFTCAAIRTLSPACRGCTQTCKTPVELGQPKEAPPEPEGMTQERADRWLAEAQRREEETSAALVAASERLRRLRAVGSEDEILAASSEKVRAEQAARAAKTEVRAAERTARKAASNGMAPVPCPASADKEVWAALAFDIRAGAPKATKGNVRIIMEKDAKYAGKLKWDEFNLAPCYDGKQTSDQLDTDWATDIEYRYGVAVPTAIVREVSIAISHQHPFHPVRDWLGTLQWDGQDRISNLLARGFGAIENPADPGILAEMGRIFLLSVVARVFVPGEKVDTMLILTGRQNVAKSSALRTLVSPPGWAPRFGWFGDAKLGKLGDKDTAQLLLGKLLWEIAELGSSWRNADARDRKQWLSQQEDRYRPPYGHRPIDVPRQCVVVGSTNDDTFLTDPTGNRRYLCVAVTATDLVWLREHREQLFAQAVIEYQAGRRYWVDAEFQPRLERHNARFATVDHWLYVIEGWLRKKNQGLVTEEQVVSGALGLDVVQMKMSDVQRVRDNMRMIGCAQERAGAHGFAPEWRVPERLLTTVTKEVTHHSGEVIHLAAFGAR